MPKTPPTLQPAPVLNSRLHIIRAEPADRGQDCGACRNQSNCWAKGIKEEHIITNLLVCRIKRDIDVNRSSKLFLQMVRPKLKTFAKLAIRGTNIDLDVALADLESQTIEYLQHYYVMGEIAYPLHYLFGQPNGVIRHFANNYARKTRKYEETHVLDNGNNGDNDEGKSGLSAWDPQHDVTAEEAETEMTRRARDIIEDGITLTLSEYRVLKFCLANAAEAKRPLNGLHVYLSRTTSVVRARVTKIYADATKKMVTEARSSR